MLMINLSPDPDATGARALSELLASMTSEPHFRGRKIRPWRCLKNASGKCPKQNIIDQALEQAAKSGGGLIKKLSAA
jgi:hypothetical protein